jgi:hypothetical protein
MIWDATSSWEIVPYVGVGNLRFGQVRANARAVVGDEFSTFRKGPFATNDTDAFDKFGLHLFYDSNDCLESIDAFGPTEVKFHGLHLVGRNVDAVLAELEKLGFFLRCDDDAYVCVKGGFSLYCDNNLVKAVTVFRRGYHDGV